MGQFTVMIVFQYVFSLSGQQQESKRCFFLFLPKQSHNKPKPNKNKNNKRKNIYILVLAYYVCVTWRSLASKIILFMYIYLWLVHSSSVPWEGKEGEKNFFLSKCDPLNRSRLDMRLSTASNGTALILLSSLGSWMC